MKNKLRNTSKGISALVVLTFMFASMGIFSRYMQTSFTIFDQTYLRMGTAFLLGLIFFPGSFNINRLSRVPLKDWIIILFRVFANYVGGVILFTLAVFNTKLGNVSLIQSLPLVAVFGFIFLREKLSLQKIIFILLCFLGVLLLEIHDFHSLTTWGKGEIYSLIAAFSFSIGYIARRWQTDYLNNKEITQLMLILATGILFIFSLLFHERLPISGWTFSLFFVLIISAFFNVAGLFLTNYGFEHVESSLASNLLTLESVFGLLLGFIFYKEVPAFREYVGGFLILLGVILLNQLESKKSKNSKKIR